MNSNTSPKFPAAHGSPYDRGGADYYYHRPRKPHKGGVGGNSGPRIEELTEAEQAEYELGYCDAEKHGDRKDYS